MTDVILAGIGQTPVGELWDVSLRSLAVKAIQSAIRDSGGLRPQMLLVGNCLAPSLSRQAHLGVLLADFAGLTGIEAVLIEASNASGAAALRQGYLAIASGVAETALVVGVEKVTDYVGPDVDAALASASDSDYEAVQGVTLAAQAALLMKRYMHEYHVPANGLAGFSLVAHENAVHNPNAMFHKPISLETYQKAEMVSEPLNVFDMAPNADGAAAVLLARRDLLPEKYPYPLVKIAGSAIASDTLALHDRADLMAFEAVRISTQKAMRQADIRLEEIDFFEYHDAFSIYAALSLEASGFAPRGQGWKMAQDGSISRTGSLPCATLGGLKARGNPGSAAGVYQAVEAAAQLRGQAGAGQLQGVRVGMIQSLGGPAATAVTHILQVV